MNIAIYTRVSTTEQRQGPQLMELRAAAAARGWTITHEFEDVISGAKTSRDGWDRLMALVRAKQVDGIMVVKIDRIARSLPHFITITRELEKQGIALIVPGQQIDTSKQSPCGRFQLAILGAVAELERDFIRERTVAGLASAKASGVKLGRPSMKLVTNWKTILVEWRSEGGVGVRELARRLGGVSISTAARLARSQQQA